MKNLVGLFILSFALILSACGNSEPKHTTSDEAVKERVYYYSVNDIEEGINVSIDSKVMSVTNSNGKVIESLNLPEDEFFVSIAPFKTMTHPCEINSLSGCQGELIEEELHVTVVDQKGNTIIDENMTTNEEWIH